MAQLALHTCATRKDNNFFVLSDVVSQSQRVLPAQVSPGCPYAAPGLGVPAHLLFPAPRPLPGLPQVKDGGKGSLGKRVRTWSGLLIREFEEREII